ncbi:phage protein Gp37/Gp68 [Leptospira interrogans serovar Medanensis str. L0448]|uniref:DUF5131 family protein n=1 Tax=Leptospira interrogans TaxID=173 RepID=UPI000297F593|nr:phage Gp37/Gp68 family protein [Leptospira interrogans]EKR82526.1 phage protein Gp37/Gp68 [Leptospira interrogans str. UI 08452]EMN33209.1 phage protein Gp37/Gp68 [Leptospira interrogans serovar Medanensis str. L0448]
MKNSKIEWTDHTWNPVTGCTKVSAGCRNCYAETISKRKFGEWKDRDFSEVALKYNKLFEPFSIRKPSKIFVNSMSDLFHDDVPDSFIDRIFGVMALNPKHTFQVLTKRPERMLEYLTTEDRAGEIGDVAYSFVESNRQTRSIKMPHESTDKWSGLVEWPLPNVWLGVSVEDQETADERIPFLMEAPAKIKFISAEPLLGEIDLTNLETEDYGTVNALKGNLDILSMGYYEDIWGTLSPIDWVIAGGESGPNARLVRPNWIRNLRDQCTDADVPFFFKQWGDKRNSRARLDGEEWKQFPKKAAEKANIECD